MCMSSRYPIGGGLFCIRKEKIAAGSLTYSHRLAGLDPAAGGTMAQRFDAETRERLIHSIQRYFREEMDDEIGELKASLLLDFFAM